MQDPFNYRRELELPDGDSFTITGPLVPGNIIYEALAGNVKSLEVFMVMYNFNTEEAMYLVLPAGKNQFALAPYRTKQRENYTLSHSFALKLGLLKHEKWIIEDTVFYNTRLFEIMEPKKCHEKNQIQGCPLHLKIQGSILS